jgi:ATP-dependent metalloprotease FtsH
MRGGGAGLGPAAAMTKSKARVFAETDTKTTFADVAGVDEAKEELNEIVAFLRDPANYGRLGAHVPKGILLVGPPGTGKTLLARAVAGEAGVPFLSINGSEFVELYVGVGAARVRDLFEQGRQMAPAIIFIDELDALGRARGAASHIGSNDEKEQTLNQLLSEVDGFDPTVGLVLLAATNRPEILDPALLRSGRFDRQVLVDRPDKTGRIQILNLYLKRIRLGSDVSAEEVAAMTPGFTGADLATLVNEAALLATRRNSENVVAADFAAAIERIVAGLEKKNRLLSPNERRIVAYHEMGHALVSLLLPGVDRAQKVSIIPRGVGALGYTIQRPTEDRFLLTEDELHNKIAVLLAGRAAERLIFGKVSTGAADDLAKASDVGRSAATQYGMVPALGDVGFIDRDGFLFVTGRLKEILVLGGGKKVSPEELERIYGDSPEIAEIAVLEDKGALVALVRPDAAKLYARGATNLRDGIRVILGEKSQHLPSFLRLSGFALTSRPLPRTRLGKYRRFLLPSLYHKALAGNPARVTEPLTTEDQALLRNPAAAAVWDILRQRFPDQPIDLDTNLSLDLNLDSFGWMELAITLHDRTGIMLSDEDLGHIQSVRDLLRLSTERGVSAGAEPRRATASSSDIEDWLAPTSAFLTALGAVLYAINRMIMRSLFRLHVAGSDKLPPSGPFVIAPNHVSYLDVLVIAAALSRPRAQNIYWAGDAQRLFPHALGRIFCRAVHLFPVDAMHPGAVLETARRVLQAGNILVWFPEGWRSPDGRIQRFLPGIGQLLLRSEAPAVPAYIGGTFAALPRGQRLPRFRALSITFGEAAEATSLCASGDGATNEERVADGLRQRLTALARRSVEEAIWVRRD